MITLTRLRQNTPFILNPDLIERVDTHVDTVVRLTSGTEYVVNETGEEIVRRTAEFRARVLSLAGMLQAATPDEVDAAASYESPAAALAPAIGTTIFQQAAAAAAAAGSDHHDDTQDDDTQHDDGPAEVAS